MAPADQPKPPWQEALLAARTSLNSPAPASAAGRLRRARRALLQAKRLGADAAAIHQLGLESAVLALAQGLGHAGLGEAARGCTALASLWPAPIHNGPWDLNALNAWVYPRSLRRYQLEVLNGHALALECNGEIYHLRDCRADADRNQLLWQRSSDQSWWSWVSDECADGYRLPDQGLQPVPAGADRLGQGHASVARLGNANFAHFLWNELDPLLRVLAAGRRLELVQDTDTVLDLTALEGITRLPDKALNERPSVRLGGTLVSKQARATLLRFLRAEPTQPLPPRRPRPLILLGVRGPGRRELHNEVAYYTGLIEAITVHFCRPLILLDGFTYQHNNRNHAEAQQREQACNNRIKAIMAACPQAQLESLSGHDFAHWLHCCEGMEFYITHEGTMQHKPGWLMEAVPGLCLVGSARAEAIASWHRLQCEGADALAVLPTDLYAQDHPSATSTALDDRDRSFRILDIPRAIQLTMEQIRRQLELNSSGA